MGRLDDVVTGHGGLPRWRRVNRLRVDANFGGGIWPLKRQGGELGRVTIDLDTHRQHVECSRFGGPDQPRIFEPNLVAVTGENGRETTRRESPRAAFAGHVRTTPLDDLHLAYSSGYAMWNYMNMPFLFCKDGLEIAEIEPWNGERTTWRRLQVRYPDRVGTRCKDQVFYREPSDMLRRRDYTADVTGSSSKAHLADCQNNIFAGHGDAVLAVTGLPCMSIQNSFARNSGECDMQARPEQV